MKRTTLAALTLVLASAPAPAQEHFPQQTAPTQMQLPPIPPGHEMDAEKQIERHLCPPELVMRFARKVGLEEKQREAIKVAIQEFQSGIVDLEWRMQDETQQLNELLTPSSVDESAVLETVDGVMDLERQIKKAHLTMLVRIKNNLSKEQQTALDEMRLRHGRWKMETGPR